MGFLILPQCALCCCLVPNHLTSYIQESWAWGSIFQYNTLYHIFISLGTKETMSKDLRHESNDLLQETSRFTFILLFCSLSNIKMYMHALRSTWVIDVVPCLNTIGYWIWLSGYGWDGGAPLLEENYCCITTIDSQQATLRLICYIGFFVSKKVHFKFSSTMVVLLYFRTTL